MCLYPKQIHVKHKLPNGHIVEEEEFTTVSCGKCIECCERYSNEWANRIMLEAKYHEKNCALTLTYNDENLPKDGSVSRREVQLFMKRLRKAIAPIKVRFFACGEYGAKGKRPHYHVIIFGYDFEDKDYYFTSNDGNDFFRSPLLEKIWPKGYSLVGPFNRNSAKYCAKYLNKLDRHEQKGLTRPFTQMSLGIGFQALGEIDLNHDRFYLDGKAYPLPLAFIRKLERIGFDTAPLRLIRKAKAELQEKIGKPVLERIKAFKQWSKRIVVKRSDGVRRYDKVLAYQRC